MKKLLLICLIDYVIYLCYGPARAGTITLLYSSFLLGILREQWNPDAPQRTEWPQPIEPAAVDTTYSRVDRIIEGREEPRIRSFQVRRRS